MHKYRSVIRAQWAYFYLYNIVSSHWVHKNYFLLTKLLHFCVVIEYETGYSEPVTVITVKEFHTRTVNLSREQVLNEYGCLY